MDTINMAFESLLDSLFQDMAWDISSDISVMKTMMAQDGLTVEGQGMGAQAVSQTSGGEASAQGLVFGNQAVQAQSQTLTQPK